MRNAFTVDVEDYFHVTAFSNAIDMGSWSERESRVQRNTHALLCLLEQRGVKGTFFVLGWVARRHPELVREIATQGHEIASHGMNHELVYHQSEAQFREEARSSKQLLEDIVQRPVIGYRAATYSITRRSLWALDVLAEEGYLYDSSVFPMRHDKYGIPDARTVPHRINTLGGTSILEFPISVLKMGPLTLPVAGGGYFRLLPYPLTRWGLEKLNARGQQFVFYIHPWEIDPFQPRIDRASAFSKFRHYSNIDSCHHRLIKLLRDFSFSPLASVLQQNELLAPERAWAGTPQLAVARATAVPAASPVDASAT